MRDIDEDFFFKAMSKRVGELLNVPFTLCPVMPTLSLQ